MYNKCLIFTFAVLIAKLCLLKNAAAESEPSVEKPLPTFYTVAIDQLFQTEATHVLAAYIRGIYQINDEISFKIMVESQLLLFWKYQIRGTVDDKYLLNVGYYFLTIQQDKHYSKLSSAIKDDVENAIKKLPSSVQYLYFQKYFCLLNQANSEFIYTTNAIEIDNERRYIFTWREPNGIATNGAWLRIIQELPSSNDGELNLQFSLYSNEIKMYLYLERKVDKLMDLIVAWRNGSKPDRSSWSVQLIGNRLVFSQEKNSFIMCSSEKVYNTYRRYVYGYNDYQHTPQLAACQWIAKACPYDK